MADYMDSLEEYRQRMLMYTDGDWSIEKMGPPVIDQKGATGRSRGRFNSLVKHYCYGKPADGGYKLEEENFKDHRMTVIGGRVAQVVSYPDEADRCWRCTAWIPEGIVGLWKMQNWKEMGYGE